MPKKLNNYKIKDEDFILAIKNSISIRGALNKLGLVPTGSAFRIFKKRIAELNIDTTHLLGQSHLTGRSNEAAPKRPMDKILVINSNYQNGSRLKIRLIKEMLFIEECYECHIKKEWNNKPLVLQLDHINGIHTDNRIENLRLLCPNCHSQTETFAGRNVRGHGGT